MYPQVTRTSSVSTIRPNEGAYVGSNGPEHPYAMYPQNTVPEEDAVETTVPMIPVGFPGMTQNYQRQIGSTGEDVADIIGPDGHTEQLPPYSRYPDEVPRKIAVETADVPPAPSTSSSNTRDVALSEMTTLNEQPRTGAESDASSEETTTPANDTFAEKLKRKSRKRICCGVPLYFVFGVVGMIILAGTIGGVIGGVVVDRQSKQHKSEPSSTNSSSATTSTVTTTSWIDASPITSSTVLAAVPTGQYQVSLQDVTSSMDSCIADTSLTGTWACEPPMGIGINVQDSTTSSNVNERQIILDPYPISANFSYGAQPPDLEGEPQKLLPFYDKDALDLGPALFFCSQYNKTIILPETAISPSSKRSLTEAMIYERQYWHRKQDVTEGDKPWFCFWNNTILEFFIYVDRNTSSSSSSTTTSANSGAAATTTSITASATAGSSKRSNHIGRRGDSTFDPVYPRYVKIEEKRKPVENIVPYCVQVEVDGSGNPFTPLGAATITISEVEPTSTATSATTTAASAKFRKLARDANEPEPRNVQPLQARQTSSLDSYCSCEWLST
ncbi:hypothetical protein UCRPC4_g00404 [Phaeomoniella chlamydospora]|uniref:DUF7820 domain-containing protein n=1 Tax=Phaeomoniella chlamydospora TaxID=158046 RepID=A0A0G2F2S1_PHACM|nr:hypothetical protein UCRPC4_g00404 [Phaeomoniella chlamydospora]